MKVILPVLSSVGLCYCSTVCLQGETDEYQEEIAKDLKICVRFSNRGVTEKEGFDWRVENK